MQTTLITRDPFARAELLRRTVPKQDRRACGWCGNPGKFLYAWENDQRALSESDWNRQIQFCSVGCYRAFQF